MERLKVKTTSIVVTFLPQHMFSNYCFVLCLLSLKEKAKTSITYQAVCLFVLTYLILRSCEQMRFK